MGSILITAGIAGLIVTAAAVPAAAVLLRTQGKKLMQRIRQEYEEQ